MQGMNMLAATLLLTCPTEEDAFWILCCIVEVGVGSLPLSSPMSVGRVKYGLLTLFWNRQRILPSDYYSSRLLVSQADQRVLKHLVARILPTISRHFEEVGIELPAVTFGWFLSLFCDGLPIQVRAELLTSSFDL
jgi:Rab-GTPase-TBC domain